MTRSASGEVLMGTADDAAAVEVDGAGEVQPSLYVPELGSSAARFLWSSVRSFSLMAPGLASRSWRYLSARTQLPMVL